MIGDNVKKFRKKRELTQDRLARKADIPYTILTKLEGSSAFQVGEFSSFGSMHVSTLSRKYS